MFRLINFGLKQSAITFHSSICQSPNLPKFQNEDENENQILEQSRKRFDEFNNVNQNFSNYHINLFSEKSFHPLEILTLNGNISTNNDNVNRGYNVPVCLTSLFEDLCKVTSVTEQSFKEVADKKILPIPSIPEDELEGNCEIPVEEETFRKYMGNLNELGHQFNTKACAAFKSSNVATALRYWNCAANFNYPPAQFNLGVYYEMKHDLLRAEKWYRLAVRNGNHPTAAFNLAMLLNNKLDHSLKQEIKQLLVISADHGSIDARNCMAIIDKLENK